VLCFVGPPGVGKTSLARSIAEALGRRFVTVSLGGVRDEAEIRGHRRTYLGAYPGRIVEALRRAGTRNPVILLDELDKLATDYRGDPAAALLEVLDPEQNKQFVDHYLDVPVDLSGVLFIATANSLAPMPRPLRDRLEAIVLEGYSEEEKREIGKRYLLPRQLAAHGLPETAVELTDSAWQELITGYTREAGVRELERQLAALCRKMAREVVERGGTLGTLSRRRVTPATLRRLLGPPPYREMTATSEPQVGLALGLGATPVGGMLVPVEVLVMPGRGELLVTGQAGEVLQESARAALSWVRAHAARLGISADFVERMDIHVHLPEGALPKEGPSAGLALVVALVSALSARPVRSDLALTGEITLRGRVLPVGDLRQKALAVQRAGLRELVAPAANQVEASRLPASLARRLTVHWVETIEQALELALLPHRNDA
jgi:ATP-dependent Lon protease